MEQVNEAQPQSQPPSQRFYALEQLGELAGTITLISADYQEFLINALISKIELSGKHG